MKPDPSTNIYLKHWLECYQTAINVNLITSITDKQGVIIYVNEKFCEVSQFSKHELLGQNHNIINSSYHPKEFFAQLWKTITSGSVWSGEIRNKTKNGDHYWVDTVIIPVEMYGTVQYLSLRMLITEKKVLEEKREEYTRSLERLLFITSHHLRSPVSSILGLVQLDHKKISRKDLEKIFHYLKSSADELDRYTRDLTEYLQDLRQRLDK